MSFLRLGEPLEAAAVSLWALLLADGCEPWREFECGAGSKRSKVDIVSK